MRALFVLLLCAAPALAEEMTRHADPVAGVAVVAPQSWKRIPNADFTLRVESPVGQTALLIVQAKYTDLGLDAWEAEFRTMSGATHEPTKPLTGKSGPLRYIRNRLQKPGQKPKVMHSVLLGRERRVFSVNLTGEDGGDEAAALRKLAGVVFKQLEIVEPQPAASDLGDEVTSHGVGVRPPIGWASKPTEKLLRALPAGTPALVFLMAL